MGYLVIYLYEMCQYLLDLENKQGDSQDGRGAGDAGRAAVWRWPSGISGSLSAWLSILQM